MRHGCKQHCLVCIHEVDNAHLSTHQCGWLSPAPLPCCQAQCAGSGANSIGVCADTVVGGTNDVTLISAVRQSGISKITFSKPLKTKDSKDYDLSSSTGKVRHPLRPIISQ